MRWFGLMVLALAAVRPVAVQADSVAQSQQGMVRIIEFVFNEDGDRDVYTGSGFAIGPNRIVTNAHVVDEAWENGDRASVTVIPSNSRRQLKATLLAVDTDKDLALLEVDGGNFTPLKIFGGAFREGSPVVALGYPGNVDEVTDASYAEPQAPVRSTGNFSNLRQVRGIEALLHTAAIAHGNSGGPLLDACGRVLGVNTYVSSNDRGDASFGFAVSFNELRSFLRRQGQNVNVVDDECVPPDVAASRDQAAKAKAELDAARADLERRAQADEASRKARDALETRRENRMATAGLLLVMAALAGAYALVTHGKGDVQKARRGTIGAVVLAIAAILTFLTRPSPDDAVPLPEPSASESGDAAEAATTAPDAPQAPQQAARKLSCTLDEGRSNYFETPQNPVQLAISPEGCVNLRTQYAASGNGAWQRVAVPKKEDTVSRLTFDPETMTYTQERWSLGDDEMVTLRQIKDKAAVQACGMSADQRNQLGSVQREVMNQMQNGPDERIVYRCN